MNEGKCKLIKINPYIFRILIHSSQQLQEAGGTLPCCKQSEEKQRLDPWKEISTKRHTLSTDQLFNLEFQLKTVFKQSKFVMQSGIPTIMVINIWESAGMQ